MAGAKLGHEVSQETRDKIRRALTGRKAATPSKLIGRKQTPESNAKRSAALRKQALICSIDDCSRATNCLGLCGTHYTRFRLYGDTSFVKAPRKGADHPKWKGDGAGYDTAHHRLRNLLPNICAACSSTNGRLENALLRTTPIERLKTDINRGSYSLTTTDYVRLCVTCHRRYDSPRPEMRQTIERCLADDTS